MNNYISKPMLYNKKTDMLILGFVTFVAFFLNIFIYMLDKQYNSSTNYTQLLQLPTPFILIMTLSFSVDIYNKKDVAYSYLLSTPIKKDSIIITNLLIPIIPCIISFLSYGLFSSLIFIFNQCDTAIFLELWKGILLSFVFILLGNVIVQLFQLIISNYIAAIIIPLIYLGMIIPISLIIIIKLLANIFINPTSSTSFNLDLILNYMLNENLIVLPIILIIIIFLFILLAIYLNRKIQFENFNKIFIFNFAEIIFKLFTSIFITIVLFLTTTFLFKLNFLSSNDILSLLIIIVFSSIVYILTNKLFLKKSN